MNDESAPMEKKEKRVEDLPLFGKTIAEVVDSVSWRVNLKIGKVIVGEILNRTGLLGMAPVMLAVSAEKKRLVAAYPEAHAKAKALGEGPAKQFLTMTALFNVMAERYGREAAWEVTATIWRRMGPFTLPALYDVDNLRQCSGDLFENYKKYNIAMFQASDDYHVAEIKDEPDCLTIVVDRCRSVEIANAFECPEIGKLGCEHDLGGYPEIEDKVDSVMHRYSTIAKGGAHCDFHFYRKGSEPKEHPELK